MAGVTSEGFELKTLEEIHDDIETDVLAEISPDLDTSAEQPIGQLIGIFSRQLSTLWELADLAYNSNNRQVASSFMLDSIGALIGVPREAATYSQVTVALTMTSSTTVVEGTFFVNITGQTNRWTPDGDYTASSTGVKQVPMRAEYTGAIVAAASSAWTINTPQSGVSAVGTNALDADPGAAEETDAAYRVRQEESLTAVGSSTVDAISTDVKAVDDVLEAFVFENTTAYTDEFNRPAHSFEVVIWDGEGQNAEDDEVAQAIWDSKPAGILSYGADFGTAIDGNGDEQTVYFNRATQKEVYMDITITKTGEYPAGGDDLVKQAIVDRATILQTLGYDVIALQYKYAALGVTGVFDATLLELGFSASPSATVNLPISPREIAVFETTRITVTANTGTT